MRAGCSYGRNVLSSRAMSRLDKYRPGARQPPQGSQSAPGASGPGALQLPGLLPPSPRHIWRWQRRGWDAGAGRESLGCLGKGEPGAEPLSWSPAAGHAGWPRARSTVPKGERCRKRASLLLPPARIASSKSTVSLADPAQRWHTLQVQVTARGPPAPALPCPCCPLGGTGVPPEQPLPTPGLQGRAGCPAGGPCARLCQGPVRLHARSHGCAAQVCTCVSIHCPLLREPGQLSPHRSCGKLWFCLPPPHTPHSCLLPLLGYCYALTGGLFSAPRPLPPGSELIFPCQELPRFSQTSWLFTFSRAPLPPPHY